MTQVLIEASFLAAWQWLAVYGLCHLIWPYLQERAGDEQEPT